MSFNTKNIKNTKSCFVNKCLFVLIDGYNAMKKANRYNVDWEEEDLTAQLIYYSEESPACNKWKIHIFPENRLYTEKIVFGEKKAKTAARIDMKMTAWLNEKKDIFHIEAKNICEKNWNKESGAKVEVSYQLNRYVDKGIKHIFANYYPPNSCMCGYILNGNSRKTIQKLNTTLKKKAINELQISEPINKHELIYTIQQNNYNLINLFLNFDR